MLSWLVGLCLGLLLLHYLSYRWRNRRLYSFAKSLPGPPTLPFIGNALELTGNPKDIIPKFLRIVKQQSSPFRMWIGPILVVTVVDPQHLQLILTSSKALSKSSHYKLFQNLFGNGLLTAPVQKWRRNRRLLTKGFNSKILENFIPIFIKKNQIMLQLLEKEIGKQEFDIYSYILPMTLDMICQTALGVDIEGQTSPSEFSRAFASVSAANYTRAFQIWLHPEFIFKRSKLYKTNEWAFKAIHQLPTDLIKKRKEEYIAEINSNNFSSESASLKDSKPSNFMDILIDLSQNEAEFSDEDIRDEVITIMVGGSETTALTNSFCLLMLAIHQDIQERVLEEIDSIFGDSDRELTVEDLARLVYLEQVIKETLRRWPPLPIILRTLEDDIQLSKGSIMPAGCTILIGISVIHMNKDIYPDPFKFDPDRFSIENIASRHKYSFIPFSGGARNCIGSQYAILSMKTTLATFLRRYHVYTSCKMQDIKLKIGPVLVNNNYPIRIEERKPNIK